MNGNDAEEGIDPQIRRARGEVERALDPEPPAWNVIRRRAERRRRGLVTTGAALVVVIAVLAGVAVSRDGTSDRGATALGSADMQLVRSDRPRSPGASGSIPSAVEAENAFAVDLYRQLSGSEAGNFFASPHSIAVALSMTLAGADGETKAQLERALHLTVPEAAFHDAINALDQALTAPRVAVAGEGTADPLQVVTANSLWGQSGYPFLPEFLDRLAQSYDSGMNVVDFEQQAEASRVAINTWVAEHTDGKIVDLIPEGVIDEMTRLVLVNTITFKASWVEKFQPAAPGPFTNADGTVVTAQMMAGGSGTTARGPGWQSVALPYAGGAHLVVIMPDDLASFGPGLTPQLLDDAATGQSGADVTLPKFSISSQIDLRPTLEALGVVDAFEDGTADFSRIDGTRNLSVSAVVHQATVAVDENGTEAAAATALIVRASSAHGRVVIDKPFFFAIRDDATGAVLFMGRVTDPTA